MSKELDGAYAGFGKLVQGEDLLDRIIKTQAPPPCLLMWLPYINS